MPLSYDKPINLLALLGVGLVIVGALNLNLYLIIAGAAVLGYFAFAY
jgi:hypothetical protein